MNLQQKVPCEIWKPTPTPSPQKNVSIYKVMFIYKQQTETYVQEKENVHRPSRCTLR